MISSKVDLSRQNDLLKRWLRSLRPIPEIDLVWLEGSLSEERANPASDLDLKLGIADGAFERVWVRERDAILAGLGECFPLVEAEWSRVLTEEGLVVELGAFPTGELHRVSVWDIIVLFSRLEGELPLRKNEDRDPAHAWPDPEELNPAAVHEITKITLLALAHVPGPFFNRELCSAKFVLDRARIGLLSIMYRRLGVRFPKRYKHFSMVLPREFLNDYEATHVSKQASPLELKVLAKETLLVFKAIGKHLKQLAVQAGGGFDAYWYERLFDQVNDQMKPFARGLPG